MDNCTLCHGWKEFEYHPLNYKMRKCSNIQTCKKIDCPYFHFDDEKK